MKNLISILLLLFTTNLNANTKEYKSWENDIDIFNYGSFLDISYSYNNENNFDLELGSINLPLFSLITKNQFIYEHFFIGTTLYNFSTNNKVINSSFLSLNLYIKIFNFKRYWTIPNEYIGGNDQIFNFLYIKYLPINIEYNSLTDNYTNPQLFKIGDEIGIMLSFGSIILGINYTHNFTTTDSIIAAQLHYRIGGPMEFVTR